MSTNRIISYTRAESLCKGSLGDENYSTCILNNLRFLPYMNDKAEQLLKTSVGLTTSGDLPLLEGKVYVEAQPIAVSDTDVKMLEKNDYGQISFRCLDVMAKPMLPLMDLVDLGLEDRILTVTNNINLPVASEVENLCDVSNQYISGVPVKCPEDCSDPDCSYSAYLYNLKNYLIHISNNYQTIIANCDSIGEIILSNGNYDKLRDMALEAKESLGNLENTYTILSILKSKIDNLDKTSPYYSFLQDIVGAIYTHLPSLTSYNTEKDILDTNVIQVILDKVGPNENWTIFPYYADLDGISSFMSNYTASSGYLDIQKNFDICLLYVNTFEYVPNIDSTNDSFSSLVAEVGLNFIYEIYSKISNILIKIHELYTVSDESKKVSIIKQNNLSYNLFSISESVWFNKVKDLLTTNTFDNPKASSILNLYSLLENTRVLYTGVSSFVSSLNSKPSDSQLEDFYENHGNATLISLSILYEALQEVLGLSQERVNEVELGGSFKDSGRYYFANVAYALGFGKLTDIYSIKINGAIYRTDAIVDEDGNTMSGISDSGCTRYKLKFKLFPDVANNSNLKELQMYIYPGVPKQPYCATINKYHNFAVTKYSGMFSKLVSSDISESTEIGLYMFKGYSPMTSTVDQVIRLGTADLNAIDLTKPDLDKNSNESFLQKEIVSLTNAASLREGNKITSKDLKFYLKATLQGTEIPVEINNQFAIDGLAVPKAVNYPNMSIIEFINMPLGSSFKVPEIEVYLKAEDMVS